MRDVGAEAAEVEGRRGWMGLLARARPDRLAALVTSEMQAELEAATWLRRPEVGAVMVRGRIGGTGTPFNLGEMTVTRCALRLASGAVGIAQVQGRDRGHAARAALVDALLQGPGAAAVRAAVLAPLAADEAARRADTAAKAAATRVEFFTLVRGED